MEKVKSCYIHIPFCSNICSYCDFCKFYYQDTLVDEYLDILLREIDEKYQGETLETIYIGGGTPSVLNIRQLEKIFNGLSRLNVSIDLEFTIECNVLDLTEEKLNLFKKYGVNRLSIGIQSFDSSILKFLEREYTKELIQDRICLAKKFFSNINVDLIYAVPSETLEILEKDLELFLSLDVTHISTYSLMIEEHTKLGIKGILPISEDLDKSMYETIHKILTKYGYNHYEISNYSLPGYESKHNLTYWRNEKYYGFGIGASGYINNIRYTNTKNIKKYLAGNYIQEKENVTAEIDASNYAILGLRTMIGINKETFIEKFGVNFVEYFNIQSLFEEKIILENEELYYLNPEYWYISNEILVKFI